MHDDINGYWKKLDSETLLDHPRLIVSEHTVELPDGSLTSYLQFEDCKDYVTVIAERDGKIALIKEYSYPHNEWLWQFPEGSIEAAEDPVAAACRELAEEAGLQAKRLEIVGMNYGNHRRSNERNYIIKGSEVVEVERLEGDKEEMGIEVHWLTARAVQRMVVEGQIRQKNALAALALYLMPAISR